MVQIFIVVYLVISLPVALLLWTVLAAAKRGDDQILESAPLANDRFVESKTESIKIYSS